MVFLIERINIMNVPGTNVQMKVAEYKFCNAYTIWLVTQPIHSTIRPLQLNSVQHDK